jgi:anaerobic ribonucleoside-triphosphate reductase
LQAEVGKITLNLPRAAYRSGADQRSSIESEIEAAVDLIVKGHLERRRFVERLSTNRENPLWELTGTGVEEPLIGSADMVFRVGIVGLNEGVKYLTGHELHQSPSSARFGQGLVGAVRRKLLREERSLGVRLLLEETVNVGPVRVLERADRRRCSQMREIDRGRNPEWGPAYTSGVRIHKMAPVDPFRRIEELSHYMSLLDLAGGFVEDFPELRSSAHDLLISLLEECRPLVDAGTFVGAGIGADRREEKR